MTRKIKSIVHCIELPKCPSHFFCYVQALTIICVCMCVCVFESGLNSIGLMPLLVENDFLCNCQTKNFRSIFVNETFIMLSVVSCVCITWYAHIKNIYGTSSLKLSIQRIVVWNKWIKKKKKKQRGDFKSLRLHRIESFGRV